MYRLYSLLLLSALVAAVCADCSASVVLMARGGASWITMDQTNQIYDITVTNTGSCEIQQMSLNIQLGTSHILSAWGIDSSTGSLNLTNDPIPAGGSFTAAGFIANGISVHSISAAAKQKVCDSACMVAESSSAASVTRDAPSSDAPTSAPESVQCDDLASFYGQNGVTAVAFTPTFRTYYAYHAPPGGAGFEYALNDCVVELQAYRVTNSSCQYIYVGNTQQAYAVAISTSHVEGRGYTYGLGIGTNAPALAMERCLCTLPANSGLSCSIVSAPSK